MKVLVVDDDVVVHMALTMTWDDVEVVECTRAMEAFRVGVAERPDCFVVDLRLPDADGLDLVRRLRCDPRTNRTPIVVLTAAHDPADEVSVIKRGADAYLSKPFEPSHLLQVIRELLNVSNAELRHRRQRLMKLVVSGLTIAGPSIDLTDGRMPPDWREEALRSGRASCDSVGRRFWQRRVRVPS